MGAKDGDLHGRVPEHCFKQLLVQLREVLVGEPEGQLEGAGLGEERLEDPETLQLLKLVHEEDRGNPLLLRHRGRPELDREPQLQRDRAHDGAVDVLAHVGAPHNRNGSRLQPLDKRLSGDSLSWGPKTSPKYSLSLSIYHHGVVDAGAGAPRHSTEL